MYHSTTLVAQLAFAVIAFGSHLVESVSAIAEDCQVIKYPIFASANNFAIAPSSVPSNFTDVFILQEFLTNAAETYIGNGQNGATRFETNGTYTMEAIYCSPKTTVGSRAGTIAYLQHAITSTKELFNGDAFPIGFDGTKFSFMKYLLNNGYSVLAVDNLGSGGSSHPDPIAVVQQPLQLAIIHETITRLRKGTMTGALKGKKFSKVIFAGHSYGAIISNALATHHPNDADAMIFFGFSPEFVLGAGPLAAGLLIPATLHSPAFTGYDAGYLAMSSEGGREFGFWTNPSSLGGFPKKFPGYDYAREGTVAVGELATLFYGLGAADAYKGLALVITGEEDAIVCNVGTTPKCGQGASSLPAQTGPFFPNAANFTYHIAALTGHWALSHYSSPASFALAMKFLSENGL